MKAGVRVVRGPNWKWADQDGGEGNVGTVVELTKGSKVANVQWDNGTKANYRSGAEDAYDLCIFDNAQCGVVHMGITCDGCNMTDLVGMRWKCNVCSNFDLCTPCYMSGQHDLAHPFLRIAAPGEVPNLLPARQGTAKRDSVGIFAGATVKRGLDWKWASQDGGEGSSGQAVRLCDWSNKGARDAVRVSWFTRGSTAATGAAGAAAAPVATYVYRLGHDGKVDLQSIGSANGWSYFPEHLPVLGQPQQQQAPQKQPQPQQQQQQVEGASGGANIGNSSHLGSSSGSNVGSNSSNVGGSSSGGSNGDSGSHGFSIGENVKVNLDEEVFKDMQQTHAQWNPDMNKFRGKLGTVERLTPEGNVVVRYTPKIVWILHPDTLVKVKVFNEGEYVTVANDAQSVQALQQGHGDWTDDMVKILGKTGTVSHTLPNGDLKVDVGGKKWTINPASCTRATAEERRAAGGESDLSSDGDPTTSSSVIQVADKVTFTQADNVLATLQKSAGGLSPELRECRGQVGVVQHIGSDGIATVRYEQLKKTVRLNVKALTKVDAFKVGDTVTVISDVEQVRSLQKGHGEWTDSMRGILGKTGKVVEVHGGDLKVNVQNGTWTLNACCCTLANAPTSSSSSSSDDDDDDSSSDGATGGVEMDLMALDGVLGEKLNELKMMVGERQAKKIIRMLIKAAAREHATELQLGHSKHRGDSSEAANDSRALTSAKGSSKSKPTAGQGKLMEAVRSGDSTRVQMLLETSPGSANETVEGKTPLQVASYQGNAEAVQLLVVLGNANVDAEDDDGDTALHYASHGDEPDVIRILVNAGASMIAMNKAGHTPLHVAVIKQHPRCVEAFLEGQCDVGIQDRVSETPLHIAISKGNKKIIGMLVKHPLADFNVVNQRGCNVLQYAASKGDDETVALILSVVQNGADYVNRATGDGMRPVQLAAVNGYKSTVEVLLSQGKADINARNNRGQTALHLAVQKVHQDVVDYLLEQGADVSAADQEGNTCLHLAVQKQSLLTQATPQPHTEAATGGAPGPAHALLHCLLKKGADALYKNNRGESALDLAQHPDIRALIENSTQNR